MNIETPSTEKNCKNNNSNQESRVVLLIVYTLCSDFIIM